MTVYNSITSNIKLLVGVDLVHYDYTFESDFALLLRERKYANLPAMFKDALEVEANLMASGKMK